MIDSCFTIILSHTQSSKHGVRLDVFGQKHCDLVMAFPFLQADHIEVTHRLTFGAFDIIFKFRKLREPRLFCDKLTSLGVVS